MAGNMESMLLADDGDSSDDDNGTGGEVLGGGGLEATISAAPMPPNNTAARLKSLYSQPNKAQPPQVQQRQKSQARIPVPLAQAKQQNPIQQVPHHQPQLSPHMTRPSAPPNSQIPTPMMHMQPASSTPRIQPPSRQLSGTQRTTQTQPAPVRPIMTNRPADPFEPTPLTTMISRHPGTAQPSHKPVVSQQVSPPMQPVAISHPSVSSSSPSSTARNTQHMMQPTSVPHIKSSTPHHPTSSHHPSSTMHMQNSHHPNSSHHSSNSSHHAHVTRPKLEREAKKAKEQFLMFTRVLMKYLEQKDPQMHARAKEVIRECAERNKKKEQGYESVTASMKTRLRATVGEQYWKRADSYLNHFQKMQRQKQLKDHHEHMKKQKEARQQQAQQIQLQKQMEARERLERKKVVERQEAIRKQNAEKLRKQNQEAERLRQMQIQEEKNKRVPVKKQLPPSKPNNTTPKKKQLTPVNNTPRQPKLPEVVKLEPPREYNELMEMIDQSVNYDWTTAGLLLGEKTDIDLSIEQETLLYGEICPKINIEHTLRRGWNDRNLVSARNAWAMVRLPELINEMKASQSLAPLVNGISLPTQKRLSAKSTWLNEDRTEQDRTLAVLSEATQIYVKQILDRALQCARQRENLEGIRLWHMQHSGGKPPIGLRLGCDVTRQYALAAGNAALTVKRMEEALERNPAKHCDLKDPDVLLEVTSMGDLACRPKLSDAVEKADYHAKRSFEISGGKNSSSPFGRVPKQAKIMAQDFLISMELSSHRPPPTLAFHFA